MKPVLKLITLPYHIRHWSQESFDVLLDHGRINQTARTRRGLLYGYVSDADTLMPEASLDVSADRGGMSHPREQIRR